jgi:tetratricopeptide (TPR) repeat protein
MMAVSCSYAQQTETAETHNRLGVTFYEMGDLNGAIAEYQAALRLNPNHANAHTNLCNAFYAKGDANGAIAEYQAALRLNPNNPMAHHNLGVALRAKGNLSEAIAEYQAALRLNPKYVPALNNLAWLYATASDATLRNRSKALEYALQAVALENATNAHPLDTLAEAYYVNGDYANAVLTEKKALALQSDDATRKSLAERLEKYERAKQAPR